MNIYIYVRKILSKLGSESLDMIKTKHLFLARKRQVRTTYEEAGSELSDSQNGTIANYTGHIILWETNITSHTVFWENKFSHVMRY